MQPLNMQDKIFYEQLRDKLNLIKYYCDSSSLKYALELIPLEEIKIKATLSLSTLDDKNEISLEDCVVLELLHWFKNSFFSWVDAPKCDLCDQTTEHRGTVPPLESESVWDARTVEHFMCSGCQKYVRFPRYNHPKKLLETRKGRCGEWANCFTFLCCALEYDARLVVDWTDHVWTEVYSESRKKWLHCDPCENAFDKPLMYETGWNKKLSYVLAFSTKEVQDVTWRYTSNFQDVMQRRTLCSESFLIHIILEFQKKLQENLDFKKKKSLQIRQLMELAGFLGPAKPDDDDSFGGRTSGSLAWRLARGETELLSTQSAYVFKLSPEEIKQKHFHIKYSCALNKYVRVTGELTRNENWNVLAYSHSNIFRKVESDWNMVYLARTEGSSKGTISWKFDFEECGLVVDMLRLNMSSTSFDTGKVTWLVTPNSKQTDSVIWLQDEVCPKVTQEFKGCAGFELTAEISEGSGSNAWQHSQLFRQPLNSTTYPFEVEINFCMKSLQD